jgi:hypothetical protein
MVVEKNQNPSIFLATYWNLSQNSGDLEIYFFGVWKIWAIFSMENPLNRSKSYFSCKNLTIFHQKKNTAPKVLALLLDESQLCRSLWVCYCSKHLKQGCIES